MRQPSPLGEGPTFGYETSKELHEDAVRTIQCVRQEEIGLERLLDMLTGVQADDEVRANKEGLSGRVSQNGYTALRKRIEDLMRQLGKDKEDLQKMMKDFIP